MVRWWWEEKGSCLCVWLDAMWPLGHEGFTYSQSFFFLIIDVGVKQPIDAHLRVHPQISDYTVLWVSHLVNDTHPAVDLTFRLIGGGRYKSFKKKKYIGLKKNHWQSLTPWGAWSSWHLDLALTAAGTNALFFLYWSPPPPPPRRKQSHMPQYCVPCDRRACTNSHTARFFYFYFFISFPSGLPYSLELKRIPLDPTILLLLLQLQS